MNEEKHQSDFLSSLASKDAWERSDAAIALCRSNDARGWEYFRTADFINLREGQMATLASIDSIASRRLLTAFFTEARYAEMQKGWAGPTRYWVGVPALAAEALARKGVPSAILALIRQRWRRWRYQRAEVARKRRSDRLYEVCKRVRHDWITDHSGPYSTSTCRRCGMTEMEH